MTNTVKETIKQTIENIDGCFSSDAIYQVTDKLVAAAEIADVYYSEASEENMKKVFSGAFPFGRDGLAFALRVAESFESQFGK